METEKEHFSWLSQKQLLVERYTKEKWEWGIPLCYMCVRERDKALVKQKHTVFRPFTTDYTLKCVICLSWTTAI